MEFIINVKRDKEIAEKRKKRWNKNSLTKNILIVFFDGHSRNGLRLKTPLISNFLKDFTKNRELYEFFKYHAVLPYTLDNLTFFLFGVSNWNQEKDHRVNFKEYLENIEGREQLNDPYPMWTQ